MIKGYEYSQTLLINKYVEHFYNKKKTATGATRIIAKLHLNQLYGILGRKQELIQTINIYRHELAKYLTTKFVKSKIEINDDIVAILIQKNVNKDSIKELNIKFESDVSSSYTQVKTNVGLAAAVTAYSRITMMDFNFF